MRNSVAFGYLLLLLLAATAQGIRLDRQLQEAINNKQKMVVSPTSGEASRSVNKGCSSDEHYASGTVEKPRTGAESKQMQSSTGNGHTMTSVDATPPEEAGRHEAEATRHGSDYQENTAATPRVPWQGQTTYPDIAGMDYSPATRKSPIHN